MANFMLDVADVEGIRLTNLSLQKVIYFAHGHAFHEIGDGLIANRIEAWDHGPVVRDVYSCFKQFEAAAITDRAALYDPISCAKVVIPYQIEIPIQNFVRGIVTSYGRMPSWTLVELTHEPGGPWDTTVRDAQIAANSGLLIADALIQQYFRDRGGRFAN